MAVGTQRGERMPGQSRDGGQVGGLEVVPIGLLVFVIGTLLVANIWAVVDAKLAVDRAAREASRHYVESEVVDATGGQESVARGAAVDAGLAALEAHGRDRGRGQVWLSGLSGPGGQGGFVRCARAQFTATYDVPALSLPWIGGFGSGFEVRSSHSELVDPFRDGVPGTACV